MSDIFDIKEKKEMLELLDIDISKIKGDKGDNGEQGENGKDGKDGKNGIDGKNGKDGVDGKNGKNGLKGENGKDGKDGLNGKDGKNGRNGIDGLNGKNGKDGKDGSPDTAEDIKLKLESLKDDARIDASAIKNLPRTRGGKIQVSGGGITLSAVEQNFNRMLAEFGIRKSGTSIILTSAGNDVLTLSATNASTAYDIEITDTTRGIILRSPNATRWRITIDNTGALLTTSL